MKVLLTSNVKHLGKVGDTVNVARGYARNFLFPKKFALEASEGNVAQYNHAKLLVDHKRKKEVKSAQELADKLNELSITIAKKAGESEKLFGSVTNMDIEEQLSAAGIQIERSAILLEEPIKKLGVYNIPVKIDSTITAKLKVWVVEQ